MGSVDWSCRSRSPGPPGAARRPRGQTGRPDRGPGGPRTRATARPGRVLRGEHDGSPPRPAPHDGHGERQGRRRAVRRPGRRRAGSWRGCVTLRTTTPDGAVLRSAFYVEGTGGSFPVDLGSVVPAAAADEPYLVRAADAGPGVSRFLVVHAGAAAVRLLAATADNRPASRVVETGGRTTTVVQIEGGDAVGEYRVVLTDRRGRTVYDGVPAQGRSSGSSDPASDRRSGLRLAHGDEGGDELVGAHVLDRRAEAEPGDDEALRGHDVEALTVVALRPVGVLAAASRRSPSRRPGG